MRRELCVDVRLSGTLRPQLKEVIVSFAEGDKPDEGEQLGAAAKHLRVKPYALHEDIHPLVGSECLAGLNVLFHVHRGDLDRLEAFDVPGARFRVYRDFIGDFRDAPDSTDKQLGVSPDEVVGRRDLAETQVGELGLIEAPLFVQFDGDLIDHLVPALLLDRRFDQFGLIPVYVVLRQDLLDRF